MATRTISKILYGCSFLTILISFIQWYVRFEDISQLFFGLHFALTIFLCGFLYTWMKNKEKNDEASQESTKKEMEELHRGIDLAIEDYRNEIKKLREEKK